MFLWDLFSTRCNQLLHHRDLKRHVYLIRLNSIAVYLSYFAKLNGDNFLTGNQDTPVRLHKIQGNIRKNIVLLLNIFENLYFVLNESL